MSFRLLGDRKTLRMIMMEHRMDNRAGSLGKMARGIDFE
jgi:hypothetical protein